LIDGDPELVQDAINKERDWFASAGQQVFRHRSFTGTTAAASPCLFPPHPSGVQREQNKMHAEAHSRGATILGFFQITDQAED